MLKNRFIKLLVSLSLIICVSMTSITTVSASVESDIDVRDNRFEYLFYNADRVEEREDGTLYTFNELNSTVLKFSDENKGTTLIIKEGEIQDVLKIDQDNNIYLNGQKVEITYQDSVYAENLNESHTRAGVKYTEQDKPSFGKPEDYTVFLKSDQRADIQFSQAIGTITITTILGVIGIFYPGIGFTASVAAAIKGAFDAKNTKNLSCKMRHTLNKNYPSGWYHGMYCEQITTTWYASKNYQGATTVTKHYKTGYII